MIDLNDNWEQADLPAAVRRILKKWQDIADREKDIYLFGWPNKRVRTDFTYDGERYSLTPVTFSVAAELLARLQDGPYIRVKYGSSLCEDLKRAGCTRVFSVGSLI